MDYAQISDVSTLFRELTDEEEQKAEYLIPTVCALLRTKAKRVGIDLDEMFQEDEDYAVTLRSVVCDIVVRCLDVPAGIPSGMSQVSESALGYSISGTLANPGGGIFIKRSELAALGIRGQRWGVIEPYGPD